MLMILILILIIIFRATSPSQDQEHDHEHEHEGMKNIAFFAALLSNPHMSQLNIRTESPFGESARPADFANASPFQTRKTKNDPARTAVFAAVAVAVLAFFASMIALALMKAPWF